MGAVHKLPYFLLDYNKCAQVNYQEAVIYGERTFDDSWPNLIIHSPIKLTGLESGIILIRPMFSK